MRHCRKTEILGALALVALVALVALGGLTVFRSGSQPAGHSEGASESSSGPLSGDLERVPAASAWTGEGARRRAAEILQQELRLPVFVAGDASSFRLSSSQERRLLARSGAPGTSLPLDKVVREFAEILEVVVVGDASVGEPNRITMTAAALIVGESNEDLVRDLDRLTSPVPDEREEAIRDLADRDDPRLESVYVHLLAEDSGAGVRAEAAAGLGDAQRRESFRALLDALGDPDEWVRGHARYSIQRIGPGTMEPWLRIGMQSPQKDVAYESADLLEHAFGYELPEDFWHEFVERKWQQ